MKKIYSLITTGCFILLAMGIATNMGANAENNDQGYVNVQGEASAEYAPTTAKITLSVETHDKEIAKATEQNKQVSAASIAAVKKLLDAKKGENVKTLSFNVSPEYSYKNNVKTFIQYNARNSYEVTIKDVSKLGKVISTALDNGANDISGLNYSLDTNEENCAKLIQKASSIAKSRATTTANALGATVTGIKTISTQCSTNQYYAPRYSMKMMTAENAMAMDGAGNAVPTEEGTIKLRAFVDASFFVK